MHSEIEPKNTPNTDQEVLELELSQRLQSALSDHTLRAIGSETGFNSETIRRYMGGTSKIPAVFIGRVAEIYSKDLNWLLLGQETDPESIRQPNIKEIPTDALINELGRRMKMIEDCAVGSVTLNLSSIQ